MVFKVYDAVFRQLVQAGQHSSIIRIEDDHFFFLHLTAGAFADEVFQCVQIRVRIQYHAIVYRFVSQENTQRSQYG